VGRRSRLPSTGQELADLGDVHGREPSQDIGQVFLRVDPATAATDDEGVDDSAAPTGVGVSNEEPAATTDGGNPNRVFHEIVVDFVAARLQITDERRVFIEEVADRFAQTALGQQLGLERLRPLLEPSPDPGGRLLAERMTQVGRQ
jgi:hypothetical protein